MKTASTSELNRPIQPANRGACVWPPGGRVRRGVARRQPCTPIQSITDQITLVLLTIGIWSGRKKLRPEDLKLGTEIPPEDLVSLGSKRMCNPEALKVFHRLKKGAERACLHLGTRFLGGFAIPNDQAEALADELETLKGEFEARPSQFLSGLRPGTGGVDRQPPPWEAPIRRAIEPANVVGGRLRFGFQLVQIAPADKPGTLERRSRGWATASSPRSSRWPGSWMTASWARKSPPPRAGDLPAHPGEARLPVVHGPADPAGRRHHRRLVPAAARQGADQRRDLQRGLDPRVDPGGPGQARPAWRRTACHCAGAGGAGGG